MFATGQEHPKQINIIASKIGIYSIALQSFAELLLEDESVLLLEDGVFFASLELPPDLRL